MAGGPGPVLGIGIDIVEIGRIDAAVQRRGERLLRRLFTAQEVRDCPAGPNRSRRLAARFAAKEATLKALGRGLRGVRWVDAEVVKDRWGRPHMRLHGALQQLAAELGVAVVHVSLSHSRDYAVAQAVACGPAPVGEAQGDGNT